MEIRRTQGDEKARTKKIAPIRRSIFIDSNQQNLLQKLQTTFWDVKGWMIDLKRGHKIEHVPDPLFQNP